MKKKSKKASQKKTSQKRRFLRCFLLTTIAALLLTMTVMAADADTIKILKKFDMPQNNVVSYVCRWIGWALLCGLSYLVNGIESVIYNVNSTIGNFFANAKIQNLNDTLLVILFLVLLLVVLFVGLQFIIQPQQQIAPIITNAIIGIVVLVTVPYMISSLYSVTNAAIGIIGQGQQTGMGTQILLDNVTDVLRYDADNFSTTNLENKKSWYAENSSDRITDIDITEMVSADQTSHSEIFGHKVEINTDGTEVLADINTGSFFWQEIPLLSDRYYRWKVDWLVCFVSLIISAIALFLSSIRMAVALYELAIHGMMTEVMALLDVYTHQRMKKCLQLLVTTFASFFGFFLLMQIYLIGMNAISSSSADLFVKIVCMVALGWMVIDGPSIFEKVIGQDLGVRNAARTMVGIRAAGATAGAIAGKGGNLIRRGKNNLMGWRTFGGGREGGLRGRIVGDKYRDVSGQVSHTGGLVNQVRSFQGMVERRRKHRADQASDEPASAHAEKASDFAQDSAAPMNAEEKSTDASAPHVPKYQPHISPYAPVGYRRQGNSQTAGRNASQPGSPFAPVGGSSYSPSGRRTGASASSKVVRDTLFPDSGQEKKPSGSRNAVYDDLFPGSNPVSQAASQPPADTPHEQKLKSSGSADVVYDRLTPSSDPAPENAAPQPTGDTPHEPKLNPSGSSDVVLDTLVPGSDPASEKTAPQPLVDAPHEQKLKSSGSVDVVYDKLTPGSAPASEKTAPQPMGDTPHKPKLTPSGSTGYPGVSMPRYQSRRAPSAGSFQIHTPKYQPPSQTQGSQSVSNGSGSSRRSGYNVPHMPKYKPESVTSTLGGGSYPPVSSTTHNPKIQQQDVPPASTGSTQPPVSNTPYTPKVPPEAAPPVHIDNLWPEPTEPTTPPPTEEPPTVNVPSSKSDRDNKTNPKE